MLNCFDLINGVNNLRQIFGTSMFNFAELDYDQPNFFVDSSQAIDHILYGYSETTDDENSNDGELEVHGISDDDSETNSENEMDYTSDMEYDFVIYDTVSFLSEDSDSDNSDENAHECKKTTFRTVLYSSKKFDMSQCSICITNFELCDSVCELTCNHIFHEKCVRKWAKHKLECPLCRAKIDVE